MSQDLAKVESVYAKVGRESEPSALFFFVISAFIVSNRWDISSNSKIKKN